MFCMRALNQLLVVAGLLALLAQQAGAQSSVEEWLEEPRPPVAELREQLKAHPESFELTMALGLTLLSEGNHQQAADAFEQATAIDPASGSAHLFLALSYSMTPIGIETNSTKPQEPWPFDQKTRMYALANEQFEAAARLVPGDKTIWLAWGTSLFGQGRDNSLLWPTADPHPILEKIRKSLEIDPNYKSAQSALAYVLFTYTRLLAYQERHPSPKPPAWMSGDVATKARAFADEAIEVIWGLLNNDSLDNEFEEPRLSSNLLGLLLWSRRFDDAVVLCKEHIATIEILAYRNLFVEMWSRQLESLSEEQGDSEIYQVSQRKLEECRSLVE